MTLKRIVGIVAVRQAAADGAVWLACFKCSGAIRNILLLNAVLETREHTLKDGWSRTPCEVEMGIMG